MSAATAKQQEPSMEEILASIRRIIADDQGDGTESRLAEAVTFSSPPPLAPPVTAKASVSFAPPEKVRPPRPAPKERPPAPALEMTEIAFGEIPRPVAETVPEPVPAPGISEPSFAPPPMAEALISMDANASVGRAFNMLSQTVLSENARTLEDLVREMLKPMLKIWLDDNLPPLVERLVRNEIERVARGR